MKKYFIFFLLTSAAFRFEPALFADSPSSIRIPPLFWYESDPGAQRKLMMALLLYWHGRNPNSRFNLLAPVYYYSMLPGERIRVFLPLHFQYRSEEARVDFWGLYFSKKSLREKTRFLFPFYFDAAGSGKRLTYSLLYLRFSEQRFDSQFLFPLFWSYRPADPQKNSYQTLVPFYFKSEKEGGKIKNIFSPFFWVSKDPSVLQGFVPPYYWRHSPFAKTAVGFPLYWHFYRKVNEETFKNMQVAVPWFRLQTERSDLKSFFPVYWSRNKNLESGSGASTLKQERWSMFLPLFISSKKADGSSKVITPLFSRFLDPDGKEYGHSGLNFFANDIWGGKSEVFFPLYYYRYEKDFYKFRFLLLYLEKDRDRKHVQTSLFPVFRYRRDADRKRFLTLPFFSDSGPYSSRGYFLFYYWHTEKEWEQSDPALLFRRRGLFPLVWSFRSEPKKITVAIPFTALYERPDYKMAFVAPFYFSRRKEDDRLLVMPPLISRRSPEKSWTNLFFIFWFSGRQGQSSVTFLPLYRKSNFPDGFSLFLPGLYYLHKGAETQGMAGPYLWDRRGETQYEILVPFYWRFKRPAWTTKVFFPVYSFKTEQLEETGFFPIWAKTKSVERSTSAAKHFLADSHRFLPFYFYRNLDNGTDLVLPILLGRIEKIEGVEQGRTSRGRMFLLNSWEKSPGHFSNRLDPLYSYYKSADRKSFSAPTAPFPLWQYQREGIGSSPEKLIQGAFFPYYWKSSKTDRRDLVVPVFYQKVKRSPNGLETITKTTWLLNYYSSRDHQTFHKSKFLVPFYWHTENKDEQRTIVPPFWTERGLNYKREIFFPVWWNFMRDQEKMSVLFPVFVRWLDPSRKESSLFFPGYWQKKSPESSITLAGPFFNKTEPADKRKLDVLFPVFWRNKEPGRKNVTLFPFFWNWRSDAHSVSYLFPLYFRHQRADFNWEIVFPVYWKFKTDESKIRVVPPYFSIHSLISQTKVTGFAPLWSYARNPKEGWKQFQVLGGLVGLEEREGKKRLTFLYFLKL